MDADSCKASKWIFPDKPFYLIHLKGKWLKTTSVFSVLKKDLIPSPVLGWLIMMVMMLMVIKMMMLMMVMMTMTIIYLGWRGWLSE